LGCRFTTQGCCCLSTHFAFQDTFLIGLPLHHTGLLLLPLHSLFFDTFLIGLPLHHTGLLLPLHSLCFDTFLIGLPTWHHTFFDQAAHMASHIF
jgi:hypothetical protein